MQKKELLKKAIIISLLAGVILAIVTFAFIKSGVELLIPVQNGAVLAYHDEESENTSKYTEIKGLKKSQEVGKLKVGKKSYPIYYDAGYSYLANGAVLKPISNEFGKTGCAYICVAYSNAKEIAASSIVDIESIYGNYRYTLADKQTKSNEYETLSYSPSMSRGIVIYYQLSDGAGLSKKYNALVFEEVM